MKVKKVVLAYSGELDTSKNRLHIQKAFLCTLILKGRQELPRSVHAPSEQPKF